jgi:chromate transport protein ChrA
MASSDEQHMADGPPIRVIRLEAVVQGLVLGIMTGVVIMVATLVLVVRGGRVVGPHLALLAQFLPGYHVSVVGSFIGFAWGGLYGFVVGYLVSTLYNRIAMRRGTLRGIP